MLIYGIVSNLIFILLLPFYYIVRASGGKYLYGWMIKLGLFKAPDLGEKVIMLHGVSVGEVIALENLTKRLKETFPGYKIVITTGTKTGQEIAHKKYGGIADFITYFPYDVPSAVNLFLNKVRPSLILIAETEIWPNFAYYAHKRNIPLYIINGRISDSTYKLYKFLEPFFAQVLKLYTGVFTQSEEDREKLIKIGAPPEITHVMGNLKFDVARWKGEIELTKGDNRLIIAGSTHKGEDEIILKTFAKLKKQFPDIKLLLAPRHLTRLDDVRKLAANALAAPAPAAAAPEAGLRSKGFDFTKHDVVILDTLGELSKMYSICDFAFIGGSFNKTGGHNPLECIVFNKPVVSGPSIHNFRDIYGLLTRSNAGQIVKSQQELFEYMQKLLSDRDFYAQACKDCETVFAAQQGALEYVINELDK